MSKRRSSRIAAQPSNSGSSKNSTRDPAPARASRSRSSANAQNSSTTAGHPTTRSSSSRISDITGMLPTGRAASAGEPPRRSTGTSYESPAKPRDNAYKHRDHKDVEQERADIDQLLAGRELVDVEKKSVMQRICPKNEDSQSFLDANPDLYDRKKRTWTGISSVTAGKKSAWDEKDLYEPFKEISTAVLQHFSLLDNFTSITANLVQHTDNNDLAYKPDMLFCYGSRDNQQALLPFPVFGGERVLCKRNDQLKWAVSPVDAKKRTFYKKDASQLISYMKQILLSQPGRRYVYGALLSETNYQLILLDEQGTLSARYVNYHRNPHDLVHLILLLSGAYPRLNGFHEGLTRNNDEVHLIRGKYDFHLECPAAWARLAFLGRCTEGYLATAVVNGKNEHCFVKISCLTRIKAVLQEDIHKRLSSADADDRRQFVASALAPDTFWADQDERPWWRWAFSDECPTIQRFLVVQVYETYDHAISHYDSADQLLQFCEDFSYGHEWLLMKQDFIHRDVSLNNIMRKRDPVKGRDIAVLIDFDLAVPFLKRELGPVEQNVVNNRTGTKLYMSAIVLSSASSRPDALLPLHDHMDDLESCLWVLVDICVSSEGPGKPFRPFSSLDRWSKLDAAALFDSKQGLLDHPIKLAFWLDEVCPDLKPILEPLIVAESGLFKFFSDRVSAKIRKIVTQKGFQTPEEVLRNAPTDYEDFRHHIRELRGKLTTLSSESTHGSSPSSPPQTSAPHPTTPSRTSRKRTSPDEGQSTSRNHKRLKMSTKEHNNYFPTTPTSNRSVNPICPPDFSSPPSSQVRAMPKRDDDELIGDEEAEEDAANGDVGDEEMDEGSGSVDDVSRG
ncbi:hypothetical protein V5O48_000554 [Marasmius crinis-equi]|uniref:Protein kinase domain-containing protein n=1 Tax=Marasmius crinis-equi TaxID=585013 RepID=A0ABR3G0Z7_9AGAR